MSLSVCLDFGFFNQSRGWQYSSDEQPTAAVFRTLPDGEDSGSGAVFSLYVMLTGGQDVVVLDLGESAALADSGAEYEIIQFTFDDGLDVNFRMAMLPTQPGAIILESDHLIALLGVSDKFAVRVPLASGEIVPLEFVVEPLQWLRLCGPKNC